jgi:translation elongation factor EF-Tu-like GTPase
MKIPHDIEAIITFFPTDQGGKTKAIRDDFYHPQFYYEGMDWDVRFEFQEASEVSPGDTVKTFLGFLSPQRHLGKIYEGMKFQVREGAKVVAEGEVTKILDLEESAKRALERDQIV